MSAFRVWLAVFALGVAACGPLNRFDPLPKAPVKNYDGCAACSPLSIDVAWSLDHERAAWSGDRFTISRHHHGPSIWIANLDYGLTVSPEHFGPQALEGDAAKADRELIWRAYGRWSKWAARR